MLRYAHVAGLTETPQDERAVIGEVTVHSDPAQDQGSDSLRFPNSVRARGSFQS